jgi:hypothetical protein
MKTTVPLEKLLEAYAIVQAVEEYISEEKQRLLSALLLDDEDTCYFRPSDGTAIHSVQGALSHPL